jgi:hypothetical protein
LADGLCGGDGGFGEGGGRRGEFEPGAATGERWGVGKAPGWGQRKGLDQGEVEKFFVPRVEVLPNGFGIVSGKGKEFFDLGPVEKIAGADEIHPKRNRENLGRGFASFLMILGGEEIEGFWLKCAFVGGFADASFTEKNGLVASGDGVANGGELFKSVDHDRRTLEMMSE